MHKEGRTWEKAEEEVWEDKQRLKVLDNLHEVEMVKEEQKEDYSPHRTQVTRLN